MADISQIGKSIREYREKQGITQRELAEEIMVSFQAISAWERGLSVPDLENAVRIAEYFRISVDTLLTQTNTPLYVGIDGGGTKTEFVLVEENGTVRDVLFKEGSNPNDRGMEYTLQVLTEGLEQVLRGRTPKAIFCGIGGVSLPAYQKAIIGRLSERFHCDAYADSDAANVLSMGADPENSMAVICGTGSCVFVRKGEERYRIGGWGYLLDPAGSAFDVGREAIR
ncbi:MAG: helix-turn-helix domain-containing protein, partial [Oscillospiraceae bacterium]|nr:helix-turn-helix domain-containing protein [Oscillospiraceae bacterium]